MVRVGAEQCCDTEQLRTPELGSLPGVLHCGRQPEPCTAEHVDLCTHTHVGATHTHAHTHMHTCTEEQERGSLSSGDASLLHFFHVIYTPKLRSAQYCPRELDFFHVVLSANEIKSVPIGTALMEMINFY